MSASSFSAELARSVCAKFVKLNMYVVLSSDYKIMNDEK